MSASPLSDVRSFSPAPDAATWLGDGGEMAGRVRALDWRQTPLGALDGWPQSLRSALSICLGSRFPMVVLWGSQLTMLYNEAYAPLLGAKHPWALGRGIGEVWHEVADVIAPMMDSVMQTGIATWSPDGFLALERHGLPEETYFSYSFGPVRVEDGSVGGILAVTIETTQRVVSERRLAFLKRLADATAGAADVADVCAKALAEVGEGTPDLRQLAIYLGEAGFVAANEGHGPRTLAVPIQVAEPAGRLGTLVVQLNPQRPLDADYREFVTHVGRQIARAISDVETLERERSRALADLELRRIFEQAPSFVCIMKGPDHVFEFVNRAHQQLFNSAAWIGKPVREAFPDIADQGYFERLDEVYRTGERYLAAAAPVRYRFAPDQEEGVRVMDFIYAPIRDEAGQISGIFCEGFDITARKQMEGELETARQQTESQRRLYEAILGNTPDLAYVFDLSHRFVYANQGLLRMWGKSWDEAIGKNCLELGYEPWHAAMHDREIDTIARTKQPIRGEVPFNGTFGRRIYDYILVPVFGPDGEVIAVAGTTRDVTEMTVMQETLRSQAEKLRESDQRKDEFLATLAHELRNPLAPIRNSLHMLRSAPDRLPPQQVHDMLDRQVKHMVRLLDELLEVSRISRGVVELQRATVNLGAVIGDAVESSRPLIEQGRHVLNVALPPEPLFVDGDPLRLAQIVSNLLNNAARYTDPGGRIQLSARREGDEALIEVSDTGIGIAAGQLTQVFAMFGQLDRSDPRSQGGLGIGLALAQRLAQMHGGTVEAASAGPGQGSTFTVRLPALASEKTPAAPAPQDNGQGISTGAAMRVLVVDDNRDSAESTGMLLEFMGFETRVAHDGPAALVQIEAWRPRAVLLDLGMPGMDGCEVARRARLTQGHDELTLIAMTGWGQDSDRQRTHDAGFDHHLTKPVDPDEVQALLMKVLERESSAGAEMER